jgi:hypothetical protein
VSFSPRESGLLGCATGATLPGSRAAKLAVAELNGDTTAKDPGGGEDGEGEETVEFYCAGWRIPSLYSG